MLDSKGAGATEGSSSVAVEEAHEPEKEDLPF